jgi:hypothetical protein
MEIASVASFSSGIESRLHMPWQKLQNQYNSCHTVVHRKRWVWQWVTHLDLESCWSQQHTSTNHCVASQTHAGTAFSQRYLFAGLAACSLHRMLGPLKTCCMHVKLLACLPSYYSLVLFLKIKINEMYLLTSSRFHAGVCVCLVVCQQACLIL